MSLFRSKSNFIFGTVLLLSVTVLELPVIFRMISEKESYVFVIAVAACAFAVAAFFFVQGMQRVKIDRGGVRLSVFGLTIKEIRWDKIIESGTGKIRLGRNKYQKQLYVSQRALGENERDNLESLHAEQVIWFDFSKAAFKKLESQFGINEFEET